MYSNNQGQALRHPRREAPPHQELAELREANGRLRALLNASKLNSIVATDPNGLITIFNSGAEQMLGYAASEMVGKQTPAVFHLVSEIEDRSRSLSEEFGRPIRGFDVFVQLARRGETGRARVDLRPERW